MFAPLALRSASASAMVPCLDPLCGALPRPNGKLQRASHCVESVESLEKVAYVAFCFVCVHFQFIFNYSLYSLL